MLAVAVTYQLYARKVSAIAAFVCLISVLGYGTFLLIAVEKAAAQQTYASRAQNISASLADLESQYLAESSTLTPERATALGLVPVLPSQIAYEQTSASALSLR